MSKYISDKIKILSFVCIILVLYIHSGFSNEVLILNEKKTEMQTIHILQFFISDMKQLYQQIVEKSYSTANVKLTNNNKPGGGKLSYISLQSSSIKERRAA